MAGSSTTVLAKWLWQRLATDSTLQGLPTGLTTRPDLKPLYSGGRMRLYRRQAPEGVLAPFLIYNVVSSIDAWGLNFNHLPGSALVYIDGYVTDLSDDWLWDIMDRVDALLTGSLAAVGSGVVLWGMRAAERERVETIDGKTFSRKGANYRMQVKPP